MTTYSFPTLSELRIWCHHSDRGAFCSIMNHRNRNFTGFYLTIVGVYCIVSSYSGILCILRPLSTYSFDFKLGFVGLAWFVDFLRFWVYKKSITCCLICGFGLKRCMFAKFKLSFEVVKPVCILKLFAKCRRPYLFANNSVLNL